MADNDLDNMIIPSSSADETPSTKVSRYAHRLMKQVDIPTPSNKKQPVQMPKKQKLKDGVPNNDDAVKTSLDADIAIQKNSLEEEVVDKPHMTKEEFEASFPHVNLAINLMYPCNDATEYGKDMVRDCMVFISPDELSEIEDEWRDYYREDIKREVKEVLLINRQSELFEKATKAWNDSLKH